VCAWGGGAQLATAMGIGLARLRLVMCKRGKPGAAVALYAARVAGVAVEDVLSGAFPAPGSCPRPFHDPRDARDGRWRHVDRVEHGRSAQRGDRWGAVVKPQRLTSLRRKHKVKAVKIGRPPLPKQQAKGRLLSVRFSTEDFSRISRAAIASDESLSDWSRRVLLAAAGA